MHGVIGAKLAQWRGIYDETNPSYAPRWEQALNEFMVDNDGYIKPFKNTLNGGTEGFRFRLNRDYLHPIPTNQLTLNPQLKQNPNW